MLKCLRPDEVKLNITIDDIRLRSNLTTNETIRFTKKSFLFKILCFTQKQSGPLGEIKGFIQLITDSYKPINITGIDKIHLKCNCINGSIINDVREPVLNIFF